MKSSVVWGVSLATTVARAIDLPFQFYPNCVDDLLSSNQVCNTTLSPPERAAALVAALTPEEKLQNIISKSLGAPRIGLPAYNWWSEALHGVAYAPGTQFWKGDGTFNSSTSFPMPLLMAASFDDELLEKIAEVIGIEGRAFGNAGFSGLDYWTPNVNPFKDPRWGRGSETPGEDILLVKRYAAAMIKGLEGPVPEKERRVVATCKHYAANDFEDWNGATRHNFNAKISLQDMAEYYFMPFQQCVRDSRVGSIMCAYNAVNGVPSCASPYLLQTILREHWNWTEHNNYITSDCEAVLDVSLNHGYAATNAEGTAISFEAGMDTSCEYEGSSDIPGAWSQGLLKESTVDRALLRLYEGIIRAGYFDGNRSVYSSLGWEDVNKPAAQQLALQAAVDGTVLLKNDGTLPLSHLLGRTTTTTKKIALIGFWSDAPDKLRGGYSGTAAFLHTPAYAARQLNIPFTTASGPILQPDLASNQSWASDALAAAKEADYILYFGGVDTSAAGETKDRYDLNWPGAQLSLIKLLSELNKPLIVIQMGDQLDNTPLLSNPKINAILWANWPGQDGGTAVMQLVTGIKSPAGRLPVTQYPTNFTELVPMTDMGLRPGVGNSHLGRTYRWYQTPVQPFGFGLSYTTFSASFDRFPNKIDIDDILEKCNNPYPDTCPLPPLPITVHNTGNRTSDYVALAFVSAPGVGPAPYPIKTLAAFTRLREVKAGERRRGRLEWNLGNLARHDEQGNTVVYPGVYEVLLDEPTRARVRFEVRERGVVLDRWPAPPRGNEPPAL
ncbi:glycoside hydrolase superfamily [Apiosordaria backusii]|uniref:xylan 1,4-beta-xylosidase n=1 Tax=Apiosordaria backusii TaxID=314023 RepID=A0AA40A768_9PEZI|nr:glycoside hydrolase superfamily [Apiosordaria backusii]